MVAYCKGLCCREEPVRIIVGKPIYRQGVKYCRTCCRGMRIDSIWCPCCKQRTTSKSRKWKRKQVLTSVKYPEVPIVS